MYMYIRMLLIFLWPSFLPFQSSFQLGSHVFKHHQCGPGESFYFAIPWSATWRIFFVATSLQAQGENRGYKHIRYGQNPLTSSWWLTSEDLRIDLMIFSHKNFREDVGLGFEVPVWFLTRGWHLVLWNVCLGQWKSSTWLWWANEFQSCWTLCEEIGGWMKLGDGWLVFGWLT